jgi:hypothetical protein
MESAPLESRLQQLKDRLSIGWLLIAIPVIALFIKIAIIFNIVPVIDFYGAHQGGGWLGADGENYLNGVNGFLTGGLYSHEHLLSYWPAGYPFLIWMLSKISLSHLLWLVSITQSAFYGYASYYFINQLRNTKLKKYLIAIALILAFNPTLSLSSLAVGYESPIASCMLMITGLIIKSKLNGIDRHFWLRVVAVGGFFALATFMQPRWILTTVVVALIWALHFKNRKHQALILAIVVGAMALAPAALIARNQLAGNGPVISTNLGVTMKIGAGDSTAGGYLHTGREVPCNPIAPATTVTDNDLVKCVIKWYATHPVKAMKLAINKSIYFWSPWSGPKMSGTMLRNPWLKIDPIPKIASNSQQGHDLVYGVIGKSISWLWIFGSMSLFFIGFFWLRSFQGSYQSFAWLALAPVLTSWIIGLGTIGDHRFRLPTMPLALLLQVLGYFALRHRVKTGSFEVEVEHQSLALVGRAWTR